MYDDKKYREVLLNSYLKLSREAEPLKDIAYAHMVLWVLFIEKQALSLDEIIEKSAQLMSTMGSPDDSIKSALDLLKKQNFIIENDNKYSLVEGKYTELEKQLDYSKGTTTKIIEKRFPRSIGTEKLKEWFDEANTQYFSNGAEQLIALYNKKQSLVCDLEKVLAPTIKKFKLGNFSDALIQGYKEFLTSSDREEEEKVFMLLQSLLATKLVSADISPDVLNIEKYKGAEMFLDTNVLFALRLYNSKSLDKALEAFGKVVSKLGIKFFIADFTIEEYETVRKRERENFLKFWAKWSSKILREMGGNDGFKNSLFKLKCESEEDVERFFDETLKMPTELGGVAITILKETDLAGSEFDESHDSQEFEQIKNIMERFRGWKKPDATAIHDVRLMKLIRMHAEKGTAFVLTLDSTMEAYALERVNDKEEPLWKTLFSLVQILAINGGGPDFDPNDLAPLLKLFIEFVEIGKADKFDKRDLLLITEKIERIDELTDDKVISLLNKIHSSRYKKFSEGKILTEVRLEVDRSLRQNATQKDEAMKEKETKIKNLSEEVGKKNAEISELKQKDLGREVWACWGWFFVRSIAWTILVFGIAYFLYNDVFSAYEKNERYLLIEIVLVILLPAGWWIGDYRRTKEKVGKLEEK